MNRKLLSVEFTLVVLIDFGQKVCILFCNINNIFRVVDLFFDDYWSRIDEIEVVKIANMFETLVDGAFELCQNSFLDCPIKRFFKGLSHLIFIFIEKKDVVRV